MMNKDTRQKMRSAILDYLRENGKGTAAEITLHLSYNGFKMSADRGVVAHMLGAMAKDGLVRMNDNCRVTTWEGKE